MTIHVCLVCLEVNFVIFDFCCFKRCCYFGGDLQLYRYMSHMHDIFTRAIQFHRSPLCKPCVLHGVATDGGEIHAPPVTHCIGQKTPQMRPALGIHVVPSCPRGLVEIFQMHFLWTKRRPPVFIGVFLKIFKRTCTTIGACLEWSFVFLNKEGNKG